MGNLINRYTGRPFGEKSYVIASSIGRKQEKQAAPPKEISL